MPEGKKKPNILLRIFLGFLAVGALIVILAGVAIYRWSQSPEVKEKIDAFGGIAKVSMEAMQAPGAAELRKLGCKQASIVDPVKLRQMMESATKLAGEKDPRAEELPQSVIVNCTIQTDQNIPCDEVAKTYVQAARPEKDGFVVVVQAQDFTKQESRCAGRYSKTGALLEKIDPRTGGPSGPGKTPPANQLP